MVFTSIYTAVGSEKIVLPVRLIKIKIPTLLNKTINSEDSRKCLKVMELKLESIRANKVALLTPISDVS